ncbi:MAG: hypothetical protein QOJ13_1676 [Gaiellales bacterium]|jgi:hypothetical protein|nr:hypothetical protein [Gaiellales bacterium]
MSAIPEPVTGEAADAPYIAWCRLSDFETSVGCLNTLDLRGPVDDEER